MTVITAKISQQAGSALVISEGTVLGRSPLGERTLRSDCVISAMKVVPVVWWVDTSEGHGMKAWKHTLSHKGRRSCLG